jgi:hypothetical protein
MSRRAKAFWVCTAVVAYVVLWTAFADFMQVDRCLDAGGRFNDELGICEGPRTTVPALVDAPLSYLVFLSIPPALALVIAAFLLRRTKALHA